MIAKNPSWKEDADDDDVPEDDDADAEDDDIEKD